MSQDRNGTAGPTSHDLVREGEPIEVEAHLGRDDGELTAHGRHSIGVLNGTDVVPRLVAPNLDGLPRDARRLEGEPRDRLGLALAGQRPPASVSIDDERRDDEHADDRETHCEVPERSRSLSSFRPVLDVFVLVERLGIV